MERIELRYNGILAGCSSLLFLPVLWFGIALYPHPLSWFVWLPASIALAIGAFFFLASFETRPLLIAAPEGIYLPCVGNLFFRYDEVEVWVERVKPHMKAPYYIFSLQGRPRCHLELSRWAWLRGVRVNTLLDGDFRLDGRFFLPHVEIIAPEIQARIDRAAAAKAPREG